MTKAELAYKIATKTGLRTADILTTLDSLFDVVKENVSTHKTIYLRGFGSFQTKHRAARKARNIKKNIEIEIEAHYYPSFKPCKEFIQQVKKKTKNDSSRFVSDTY